MHQTWQTRLVSETQDSSLIIELTWKNLKSRNPSQTTVAMPQVLASHCCTKVVTISLLAAMCLQGSRFDVTCRWFFRQWSLTTTTNEIVTTSKRLETASHGMETSKKWGLRCPTKSEWNHNELFCRHQIFNMLKICQRTRQIILAVCGRYRISQRQLTGNTRWLAANSKLQFAA